MNEAFGQKTTVATIGGNPELLVFGSRYNVRDASDRVLRGVELVERYANGDLRFVFHSAEGPDLDAEYRVRTSKIDTIVPIGTETVVEEHVAKRLEGETASAMLARLERALGGGQYARWIATGYGQEILAEAAREDRAGRNGKVSPLRAKAPAAELESATISATELERDPRLDMTRLTRADADAIQSATRAKGRPYAERNQVWRCGTCKRRTRAASCSNGHPEVKAPAGKRREDRA